MAGRFGACEKQDTCMMDPDCEFYLNCLIAEDLNGEDDDQQD